MADGITIPDWWNTLMTPQQNTVGTVGGQPITVTGQPVISSLLSSGLDIWSLLRGGNDPDAAFRDSARDQMESFLKDPSSVLKDPAFLAAENLGAENVARLAGSAGMGSSGNKLAELFKYGQTAGLGYEQQRFNQLFSILSGFKPPNDKDQERTIGDLISQLFGGGGVSGIFNQIPWLAKLLVRGTGGGGSSGWTSGFDLPGGDDGGGGAGWTGGFDLPGGGDIPDWTSGFDLMGA